MRPPPVVRAVTRAEWEAAHDPYHPPELDEGGFIHLSTSEQVAAVCDVRFAGRDDVLLLVVDATALEQDLVWEEASGRLSGVFPHLYAPLPHAAVEEVVELRRGPGGRFVPPAAGGWSSRHLLARARRGTPSGMAQDTGDDEAREDETGVVFARDDDGRRSTSAVGQAVVTGALRGVAPAAADAAARETSWRTGYLDHVRRLTSAGLASREVATTIARDGLAAVDEHMAIAVPDGDDLPATHWLTAEPATTLATEVRVGDGVPETELSVPYRGQRVRGDGLRLLLDAWVADGVVEPSFAEAIRTVIDNPDWLRLDGRTVAVLGAGAEMGPTLALLRWGATVAAVDLPGAPVWERLDDVIEGSAGTLLAPVVSGEDGRGVDLLRHGPAAADWLAGLEGDVVLSNDVYADGSTFVRVAMAADLVSRRVVGARPGTTLSFLATPTDVYGVPGRVVEAATAAYEQRSRTAKLLGRPLRTATAGRLLQRPYAKGVHPGLFDALVPQQGPNYALAKRLQRWRATTARTQGIPVSLHVAPATRTRSVTRNRVLAAAYAGADRFGIEVFEPGTTNTLMAALLVHDLHTGPFAEGGELPGQVWQDEAHAAAHGGLWTCRYAPRSVLGISALVGLGGARG